MLLSSSTQYQQGRETGLLNYIFCEVVLKYCCTTNPYSGEAGTCPMSQRFGDLPYRVIAGMHCITSVFLTPLGCSSMDLDDLLEGWWKRDHMAKEPPWLPLFPSYHFADSLQNSLHFLGIAFPWLLLDLICLCLCGDDAEVAKLLI